jgi:hypothetical protein
MRAKHTCLVCLPLALAQACIVQEGAKPMIDLGATLASKFVHRGMTMVDKPVLQPHLAVGLPATTGGTLGIAAEGNIDLTNDTGDAWFPDGHAGRFTQIEFIADYTHKVDWLDVRLGLHNYNLPNGLEFPNGERGGTSEAFLTLSAEVLEATPYLSFHYDWDEVRDLYVRAGITESFDLTDKLSLRLDGSLGHAGKRQSSWIYGIEESGLADLRGSVILTYAYDKRTLIELGAHGSKIIDSELDRWFDDLGISANPLWLSLGISWSF